MNIKIQKKKRRRDRTQKATQLRLVPNNKSEGSKRVMEKMGPKTT